VPEDYRPVQAKLLIPQWYKSLESYNNGEKKPNGNAGTSATAKKCMPLFDSMALGYIILTHADIWVSQQIDKDTGKYDQRYEWSAFDAIEFHPIKQLPEHPLNTGHETHYPKWMNAWSIKTPKGYSTLFIPPSHRETPITILPGVVDTDVYDAPVNFPFVLKDPGMEGLIPAGTPVAQVIPFKRDSWKSIFGKEKQFMDQEKTRLKLKTMFFDSYKKQFRQPKEYN